MRSCKRNRDGGEEKLGRLEGQRAVVLTVSSLPTRKGMPTNLAMIVYDNLMANYYIAGFRHTVDETLGPNGISPHFTNLKPHF